MTPEQIMAATNKAIAAISIELEKIQQAGKRPISGVLTCPVCESGALHWFIIPGEALHYQCEHAACVSGNIDK